MPCHELDSIQHLEFTCDTSCLTYAEGVAIMVLRKISGPKKETGKKLHNEEIHDLFSSPIIIRVNYFKKDYNILKKQNGRDGLNKSG